MSGSGFALPPPRGQRGHRRNGPAHRIRESLQRKLFLRESFGQIRSSRRPTANEVACKLFSRLPVRLAFCLKDAVPLSAIEAGHIFLGFSKCGQFLLSYTQTTSDIDLGAGGADLNIKYNYRLHWWLFVPYKRAKKVAEALLFSDGGVYGGLHISFCQWAGDWTKLVVYASAMPDYESSASSRPCYLTVTAVPSLDACKDCSRVADSYEEEDVAEGWNSCVRLSCLRHGVTLHTSFDLVPPYPSFEPKVNLKRDNHVLVNTGNLLHSLHIQLEPLCQDGTAPIGTDPVPVQEGASPGAPPDPEPPAPAPAGFASPGHLPDVRWSELQVGPSTELTLQGGEVFSPPMCSPGSATAHYWSATSDSETTDCESEQGDGASARKKASCYVQNEERLEKVAQFVEKLGSSPSPPSKKFVLSRRGNRGGARFSSYGRGRVGSSEGRLLSLQSSPSSVFQCHSYESLEDFNAATTTGEEATSSSSSSIRRSMAEKAYELTDDDFSDGVKEKLSTFRKKRLAEKTYEFTEEDLENVTPLPRLRSQATQARQRCEEVATLSAARSPERYSDQEQQVLRQLQDNQLDKQEQLMIASPYQEDMLVDSVASSVPELLSPGGMLKKDRDQSVMMSPRSSCGGGTIGGGGHALPPRFQAKYTRRFVDTDGEMISVVTDVEDDEVGGTYCGGLLGMGGGSYGGGQAAAGGSVGGGSSVAAVAAGYHTVLPLEVHGAGYQPMSMISNARAAERHGQHCVKVTQRSFDLEVFCYQMAQKLCQAAGKKYWFCNDYDVEVVDLDPVSGDVVLVAVVLVSATVFTKKVSQRDKCSISSLHRHQYQVCLPNRWSTAVSTLQFTSSFPYRPVSSSAGT